MGEPTYNETICERLAALKFRQVAAQKTADDLWLEYQNIFDSFNDQPLGQAKRAWSDAREIVYKLGDQIETLEAALKIMEAQ